MQQERGRSETPPITRPRSAGGPLGGVSQLHGVAPDALRAKPEPSPPASQARDADAVERLRAPPEHAGVADHGENVVEVGHRVLCAPRGVLCRPAGVMRAHCTVTPHPRRGLVPVPVMFLYRRRGQPPPALKPARRGAARRRRIAWLAPRAPNPPSETIYVGRGRRCDAPSVPCSRRGGGAPQGAREAARCRSRWV